MVSKALSRDVAAAVAASGALAGLVVLYRRVGRTERAMVALAERVQAHETGLDFLTQELEALRPAELTSPAPSVVTELASTPQLVVPRPPAFNDEDGMSELSEVCGYRTADEDEGEGMLPPPPFGPPPSQSDVGLTHSSMGEGAGGWAFEGQSATEPPVLADSRDESFSPDANVSGSTSGDDISANPPAASPPSPSTPLSPLAASLAELIGQVRRRHTIESYGMRIPVSRARGFFFFFFHGHSMY